MAVYIADNNFQQAVCKYTGAIWQNFPQTQAGKCKERECKKVCLSFVTIVIYIAKIVHCCKEKHQHKPLHIKAHNVIAGYTGITADCGRHKLGKIMVFEDHSVKTDIHRWQRIFYTFCIAYSPHKVLTDKQLTCLGRVCMFCHSKESIDKHHKAEQQEIKHHLAIVRCGFFRCIDRFGTGCKKADDQQNNWWKPNCTCSFSRHINKHQKSCAKNIVKTVISAILWKIAVHIQSVINSSARQKNIYCTANGKQSQLQDISTCQDNTCGVCTKEQHSKCYF